MTVGEDPIWFAEDDVGKSLRTLARPNKMHNAVISANKDLPTVALLHANPIAGAGTYRICSIICMRNPALSLWLFNSLP
ncbi:MAG: hypothetical protein OXT74_05880, partial [Candidatus Poribacteria bacterium]|nr:hypothetical protein [Candidatus Poribacteria bacterium]